MLGEVQLESWGSPPAHAYEASNQALIDGRDGSYGTPPMMILEVSDDEGHQLNFPAGRSTQCISSAAALADWGSRSEQAVRVNLS